MELQDRYLKWVARCLILGSFFGSLFFEGIVEEADALPDYFTWIQEQISEDLTYLKTHPITSKPLTSHFNRLSLEGAQALYCRIRNRSLYWEKTIVSDEYRNAQIFRYMGALNAEYALPDTDFILITSDGVGTFSEIPVFAFSKTLPGENVILFPDFEMCMEVNRPKKGWARSSKKWTKQYPWKKKCSTAFFRGASTGPYLSGHPDFGNDRMRVVLFSRAHPDLVDATFSTVLCPQLKDFLASIHQPILRARVPEHYQYKYLLDVDGYASTYSRCRWILFSNSVLVKVMSRNAQWYYKVLEPWVHYVPVQQDLSDLAQHLEFLQIHDDLAQKIGRRGQQLANIIFSKDQVDLYVFHLLHSYAREIQVFSD